MKRISKSAYAAGIKAANARLAVISEAIKKGQGDPRKIVWPK